MKKAVIFLDYNETFDDIADGKGNVFIAALRRFVRQFDGNVKIVVITSAKRCINDLNIKDDLAFTLHYFPSIIKEKFAYLVEENCKYIYKINTDGSRPVFQNFEILSLNEGTKKDGVERVLKRIDPKNEVDVCVFAGNSETLDLEMMDSKIGNRDKYFILANRRILKGANHPVYRLSMQPHLGMFDFVQDVKNTVGQTKDIIIKTTNNSYGVGKAMELATNLIADRCKE